MDEELNELLSSRIYGSAPEDKSLADKLLGMAELQKLHDIMCKRNWTIPDMSEALYLMSGIEIKLANFDSSGNDRYLIGKYYAWIAKFVNVAEETCKYTDRINKILQGDPEEELYIQAGSHMTEKLMHSIKSLVNVYMFLVRSTLSGSAYAFETLATQKYDYQYSNSETNAGVYPQQPNRFNILAGRNKT